MGDTIEFCVNGVEVGRDVLIYLFIYLFNIYLFISLFIYLIYFCLGGGLRYAKS